MDHRSQDRPGLANDLDEHKKAWELPVVRPTN